MGRFGRVANAFEVSVKLNDCDSSGEHSPETMMDLSDLVNYFIEDGNGVVASDFDMKNSDECDVEGKDDDMEDMKEALVKLFLFENGDYVRSGVVIEVEKAWRHMIRDNLSLASSGAKRRLMTSLRDQGFDAGLCKSKWEKNGRLLYGDHEYVDVNVAGTRYIIIVSLLEEFEIARPADSYTSLLQILPQVLVCKVEELKEIVRIMSKAIKTSMNQMKMRVPPWRRREYIQSKWTASYKRTTNEFPTNNTKDLEINNRKAVRFVSTCRNCNGGRKEIFGRKDVGLKFGYLAMERTLA